MFPNQFKRAPKAILYDKRGRQFELLADHIRGQVEMPLYVPNLARLERIPDEARTVYWLWLFQCEAGICGMDSFILQQIGVNAPHIHRALETVGAIELVHLLEVAISLAREHHPEFALVPDQSWFNQFPKTVEFPSLDSLVKPTFALMDSLTDLTTRYIRSHADIFFEDH